MDNKTIFVKTSKGENEMSGRTSQLPGDDKRALLMVDGTSTFGEIVKRAAPSMRASLGDTFAELEKSGYIQDQDMIGKTPKISMPKKMSVPVKMAIPGKVAPAQKKQPAEEDAGELDFLSGFTPTAPHDENGGAGKAKEAPEDRSGRQIEAEKIKAQQEAKAILVQAEQEAARIREETVRRAKEEARAIAEQEARKLREKLGNAKLKNDQEAKQRLEAAIREQQQSAETSRDKQAGSRHEGPEAAKLSAEQEAKLRLEAAIREQQRESDPSLAPTGKQAVSERDELEAARLKIELETKARLEAVARERERAEAARIKAEQEAAQILIEMEMAKQKAEQEAKARLEAEARAQARIRAEEEAARERQAAELLLRQEREAAAREAAARAAEARAAAERAAQAIGGENAAAADNVATGGFQFDEFKIEEPQNLAPPRKDRQAAQRSGADTGIAGETGRPPGREQSERAERQRIAAEEEQRRIAAEKEQQRIAAEAKARVAAEAEAKARAEAEAEQQRALELAKAKEKLIIPNVELPRAETRRVEKPARVARVKGKPFSMGRLAGFVFKLGVFLMILLAAALFIIPYVLPMRDYMPKVQQLLSARLHQPVHLGKLSGRILPMPRLELGEIYVGDAKQLQAVDAQINFDLIGLFTDAKPISSVEFHGVAVRGPWVRNVAQWLQQLARDSQYPVSRMVINNGTLDADAFQLTGVEGEMDFSPAGKFTRASLRANGGKYAMVIIPELDNKLQTTITVQGSALPMLPNWTFDELNAKGELSNDQLLISSFDARILGGSIKGDASISWRSGWSAKGNLSAQAIVTSNISKLLDAKINGTARFSMNSTGMAGLTDSAMLDGSFKASDGLISGMDIVETARTRSKTNLPGGRTRFDQLAGEISFADDAYHFKQVKLDAGVMDVTAAFDVVKQQLSGKMSVKMSMQDKVPPVGLQMGGAIDSPTLLFAP